MDFQSFLRPALGVVVLLMMSLSHEGRCESHLPPAQLTTSHPEGAKRPSVAGDRSSHKPEGVATLPDHHSSHEPEGVAALPVEDHLSSHEPEDAATLPVADHLSSYEPEGAATLPVADHLSSHQPEGVATLPITDYLSSLEPEGTRIPPAVDHPSSQQPEDISLLPVTLQHSSHSPSIKPPFSNQPKTVKPLRVNNDVTEQRSRAKFPAYVVERASHTADSHLFTAEVKKNDDSVIEDVPDVVSEFAQFHKDTILGAERIRNLARNISKILKLHPHVTCDIENNKDAIRTLEGKQLKEENVVSSKDIPKECGDISKQLKDIVMTAKTGISKFDEFKNDFTNDKFGGHDWTEVLAVLGNMDFGIQPIIPVVGEDAVLSKVLVRVYHQLQHHVVGLENATLDQIGFRVDNILTKKVGESLQGKEEDADVYLEKFTEFISYLEELLIFTMQGMKGLGVVPEGALTLEVVSEQYTFLDEALKDYRDFTVLRKYGEGLQYIVDVFTFICPDIST